MFKKLLENYKDYKRGKDALKPGHVKFEGNLFAKVIRADGVSKDLGLISKRLVTTAFCEDMVDELISETSTWGDYKYHGSGTSDTAAAISDTTLGTEVTEARATGTQVESGSVGYKTVGTQDYTGTHDITEHGIFNSSSAGIMMDSHTLSAVGVVDGDSIQWSYVLTISAGG